MNNAELIRLERHARQIGDPALRWKVLSLIASSAAPNMDLLVGAVESITRAGDPRSAMELAELGLRGNPNNLALLDAVAGAAAFLGTEDAQERIVQWVRRADNSTATHVQAVRRYHQIGDLRHADRHLAPLMAVDEPIARATLATRALWSMDLERARQLATDDIAESRLITAACDVLEGAEQRALPILERLISENTSDAVAHGWHAQALLQLGRTQEALRAADMAMTRAAKFNLTARILRIIALIDLFDQGEKLHRPELNAELLDQVAPLHGEDIPRTRQMLVDSLQAFGGNRTSFLTYIRGGKLRAYNRPPDPRARARRAQMVVKTRGAAKAHAALDRLAIEHDNHPLVHTYRGEFKLWCGDYSGAVDEFKRSLSRDPMTKWAWIGFGACRMFQREYRAALDLFDVAIMVAKVAGPTLWIYKAETRRLIGDLDGAWEDLETARKLSPRRLSTEINMALISARRGDEEPAAELVRRMTLTDPLLVGDGPPVTSLERILRRMRGNRSSSLITWFTDEGELRLAQWPPKTKK